MKLKALILTGDGINCEKETAHACAEAGFDTKIVHINDFISDRKSASSELLKTSLLVIPGGFSFGDELGSGKVFALKLKHGLSGLLEEHVSRGGAVLGICNGFQVLTKLGLFDEEFSGRCTLLHNNHGSFLNQWVKLEVIGKSIFTDALTAAEKKQIELPIRHGEGRFMVEKNGAALHTSEILNSSVLRYDDDVNGSTLKIAGVATASGRVLGLMPHPEAFWCDELHPEKNSRKVPLGTVFFKNAFQYLLKNPKKGVAV